MLNRSETLVSLINQTDRWTAVVQGAVIFGIEKATIGSIPTMRASPRSYGFMVSKLFSRVEHDPGEVRPDKALDTELVQEQLQWMIMKGDLILSNQLTEAYFPFERNLTEAGSKTGSVAIFSYDYEDKPPTNYAKFKNGNKNHILSSSPVPVLPAKLYPLRARTQQNPRPRLRSHPLPNPNTPTQLQKPQRAHRLTDPQDPHHSPRVTPTDLSRREGAGD